MADPPKKAQDNVPPAADSPEINEATGGEGSSAERAASSTEGNPGSTDESDGAAGQKRQRTFPPKSDQFQISLQPLQE